MSRARSRAWASVALAVVMLGASVGLLGAVAPAVAGAFPSDIAAGGAPLSSIAPSASAASAAEPVAANLSGDSAIDIAAVGAGQAAAARGLASGVNLEDVFVPRPSATAAEMLTAEQQGHVSPPYSSTPAPMGLAEYGLRTNATGGIEPFVLNTTALQATFDTPATGGPNATYLASSVPDAYGVQLNAVVSNVTLFGEPGYEFWTQNVMIYAPYTGALFFETNVWNWSSPPGYLSPNVFYAHGPNGTQDGSTFYYGGTGAIQVSYPFNMTTSLVSTVTDGRDAVYFSAEITTPNASYDFPDFDYVVFNSTTPTTPALTTPAVYSANGFAFNAMGETSDFELTLGGPGGGSQTTLLSANATESLDYRSATGGEWDAIPSAFTAGGETGETCLGASLSWADGPTGAPYGIVATGPSLLGGLWNESSPGGGPGHVQVLVQPANAFLFFVSTTASVVNDSAPEWAPTVTTNSFTLAAGQYEVLIAESDYDPSEIGPVTVSAGSSISLTMNLTWNTSRGIYTPLWAWTNGQIGNISTAGDGAQGDPYEIVNQQAAPLFSPFGSLNDLGFPVFPGVYFLGTTAYTEFLSPASMQAYVTTNSGKEVPTINELPWWFYDDRNVAILGAQNISGWTVGSASDYPTLEGLQFPAFNVVVVNSTGFLIANNSFQTESRGLLLAGGTGNVVWGNSFTQLPPPFPNFELAPFATGIGLAVQESGDLIYNNLFANNPVTAASPGRGFYFSVPEQFDNRWNITPGAASSVNTAPNWPDYLLTGSIVGGAVQGGNFWWDYGMTESQYGRYNPYDVLPYHEDGNITYGGDDAPLLYSPLYTIEIVPVGLGPSAFWSYSIHDAAGNQFAEGGAAGNSSAAIELTSAPIGTYDLTTTGPAGFTHPALTFTVSGNGTLDVRFQSTYDVTFTESGLPGGASWLIILNGTTRSSISSSIEYHDLINGTYPFLVPNVLGYTAFPQNGSIMIAGSDAVVNITYMSLSPATYGVTFTETGLPGGSNWTVTIGGVDFSAPAGSPISTSLQNGTYLYELSDVAGWHQVTLPYSGNVTVNGSAVTEPALLFAQVLYSISFDATGLRGGLSWGVTLNGSRYSTISPGVLSIDVPNGTYAFSANPAASYYPVTGATGSISILGGAASETVGYANTYVLSFTEAGLPTGLIWSVNLTGPGGTTYENSSFGNSITFRLFNGTYTYSILVPHGYSASPSSGSTAILGATVPVPPVSIGTSNPAAPAFPWIWVIVGVVVIVLIVAVAIALGRRRPPATR